MNLKYILIGILLFIVGGKTPIEWQRSIGIDYPVMYSLMLMGIGGLIFLIGLFKK